MQEYLIKDAMRTVWCNPYQDNQYVIEPKRMTVGAGSLNATPILGREVTLPLRNKRMHVFQVGQYPPHLWGLLENWPVWAAEKWFTFEEAMNNLPLYANIYNNRGVNIPRRNAYFMMTREKCLIIAVLVDKRMAVDYSREPIYLRLYSSAWIKSSARVQTAEDIVLVSKEITRNADITEIKNALTRYQAKVGNVEAFVNGQWITSADGLTIRLGDLVEYVYEANVKRMVTWKIKNLKSYTSEMDQKKKFILHYPKSATVTSIDYFDDIDVYVSYTTATKGKRGYYYHKNLPDAMRMLTYRDYGITGDYVTFVLDNLFADLGITDGDYLEAEVTIKIRHNDFRRGLTFDPNKTFEMYKLSDTRILMAMSGVDTLIPTWWASNLEASDYCLYMGRLYPDINISNTEKAYGYNYTSMVIGDSPLKANLALQRVPLPYGLAAYTSTAYELTPDGLLNGVFIHNTRDDDYNIRNGQTTMVEMIMGEGTNKPDVQYGTTNIPVTPDSDIRVYMSWMDFSMNPPQPNGKWEDITGDDTKYKVINGRVVWVSPETGQYLMVRSNSKFLAYSFNANISHGNLIFELAETTVVNGVLEERACPVPGGDLQIWLNGKNLVRDIDYVVNFPFVCINNYKFFKQPANLTPQRVTVRMTGFCTKDLKLEKPKATGFIVNGTIGYNRHYDSWRDKVMHLSIDGSVKHKDDVIFTEDATSWNRYHPLNGTPYQIVNQTVPLRGFTKSGTYPLREKAKEVDCVVEDYMDAHYQFLGNEPVSVAQERWRLVSPFMSQMVGLCLSNEIAPDQWVEYSDTEVIAMCKPYEVLLPFDPLDNAKAIPSKYVDITPHRYNNTVNVTRAQMRFLESVARLYGQGKIGLNNYITFTV